MLNYLRNIIIRKQSKARQFFISKNRKFNSGKFSRFNLEYKNYGKKNTNKLYDILKQIYFLKGMTPGTSFICLPIRLAPIKSTGTRFFPKNK